MHQPKDTQVKRSYNETFKDQAKRGFNESPREVKLISPKTIRINIFITFDK